MYVCAVTGGGLQGGSSGSVSASAGGWLRVLLYASSGIGHHPLLHTYIYIHIYTDILMVVCYPSCKRSRPALSIVHLVSSGPARLKRKRQHSVILYTLFFKFIPCRSCSFLFSCFRRLFFSRLSYSVILVLIHPLSLLLPLFLFDIFRNILLLTKKKKKL